MKHKTNNGFIDEEGNWHCWKCTKENELFYPQGRVVASFNIVEKNILVRIVCIGEHEVAVEAWDTANIKRINKRLCNYLSSGLREYERLIRRYLYQENVRNRSSREDQEDGTMYISRRIIIPRTFDTSDFPSRREIVATFSSNDSSFTTDVNTINETMTYLEGLENERIYYDRGMSINSDEPKIFINCTLSVPSRFRIFETDHALQTIPSFTFYNCRSSEGKNLYPKMPDTVGEFLQNFLHLTRIHEISSSDLLDLIIQHLDQVRSE